MHMASPDPATTVTSVLNLPIPLWVGAFSITIWVLTRVTETLQARRERKQERRKYISALFAEIDFNTWEMEQFKRQSENLEAIGAALNANNRLIPHITDSRHTEIYNINLDKITHLKNGLISDVVAYYGQLEKLKTRIDGLQLASFATISVEGRVKTIERINDTARLCAELGTDIMKRLSDEYESYHLTRKDWKADGKSR